METILGIDLGTTNSTVAVIVDGKPKVIEIEGEYILPSCVGLDSEGKLIAGRQAKNQIIAAPERTISSIKRKMGEKVTVSLGDRRLSPEEISAVLLRELANQATKSLGYRATKAVITVPAYFNEEQRKATFDAGALAGLDVVRMINEPTAAAIAYDATRAKSEKILVYDLGGGTFDASLVIAEEGIIEVKASHGDTHLGGDDFDKLLADHVVREFQKMHSVDLGADFKTRRRLEVILEKAKCHLSDHPFVRIREEFIWKDLHLDLEISRDEYEEMIEPLLEKTLESVQKCLKDTNLLPSALDKVMLVGGSSRTPMVHRLLKDRLGVEPHFEIDLELIVAMGASIQAATLAGQKTESILVDITPQAFGTSVVGIHQGLPTNDMYVPIIPRNTPIPARKSEQFYTMYDGQDAVEVEIYQGENPLARQNLLIGKFRIENLSDVPAGNPILLHLDLDLNGMLKVTAEEKKTSASKTVVMDTKQARPRLDLAKARDNLSELWGESDEELTHGSGIDVDDDEHWDKIAKEGEDRTVLISQAKTLRQRAESLFSREHNIESEDEKEIRELLQGSAEAIRARDWMCLEQKSEALSDILFYLED